MSIMKKIILDIDLDIDNLLFQVGVHVDLHKDKIYDVKFCYMNFYFINSGHTMEVNALIGEEIFQKYKEKIKKIVQKSLKRMSDV